VDLGGEEPNGDGDINEHKDVRYYDNARILSRFFLDVVGDCALGEEIYLEGHKLEALGSVVVICLIEDVEEVHVVGESLRKICAVVTDDFVDCLQVPDENVKLPLACRIELEFIVIE